MRPFAVLALTASTAVISTCALAVDESFESDAGTIQVTTVAEGLDHPWAIEFLPDGDILVTERSGTMRIVSGGEVGAPIEGLPEIDVGGQGGLLDVALDPNFSENRLVYFTYSEAGEGGNSTAAARGRLSEDGTRLEGVEKIFTQLPKYPSEAHFGSRIVFDSEGHLFIGLGERFDREVREEAQELDTHIGKVVRINLDGSVPQDNPFVGQEGALPEIWSYGHRNIQGGAQHPETGEIWFSEHGPMGGDEVNIVRAGNNYGWPMVSYGVNYDGTPVGTGEATAPGVTDPIHVWTPVIGASGMAFYTGDLFPEWQGDAFFGGLASEELVRLDLEGSEVTGEERLLGDLALRIRDVKQGPDGALYVATDEDNGEILRIAPADAGGGPATDG